MQAPSSEVINNTKTRILIVDDDTQLRVLYRYKLEEEGYLVFEASNGQQGIDVFLEQRPSLILMDAVMQGMDGFEASKKILELAGDDKPTLLMTTSLDDEKSVSKAYAAGASDYITKPIHWAVLTTRIKHLLTAHSAEELKKQLERQSHQAQKMAAIYRMVGGIAHDFNNLLTSVIGYSELAQDITPDKAVRLKQYLSEIDKSGSKAKTLIQKLLTFSQDSPSKLVATEPRHIIEESLTMVRESFPPSIELVEKISDHLPEIMMEPVHIYQSIINLCLNAKEAMNNKGTITVSVHTRSISDKSCSSCLSGFSGKFLELAVRDTGKGIAAEHIESVFDPFFSTRDMATGLGLSVVHGIVHEHNGHILIDSKENQGTNMRILLPIPGS